MYTKIESEFWKDEKMMKISANGRYLMLYLLTSPHRNIIGCYFLPAPYAYFDLGWSPEQFQEALDELCKAGRIEYDTANHILFIPNYLKFNPIENPNQVKSAIDKLKELPQTHLLQNLMTIVESFNKPYLKPFIERLRERLPQPVYSNSKQDTEDDIYNAPAREEENKLLENSQTEADEIKVFVNSEFKPPINIIEADIIKDWASHYPLDWIINAAKVAEGYGAKGSIKYADTTMRGWLSNGYTAKDNPWEVKNRGQPVSGISQKTKQTRNYSEYDR